MRLLILSMLLANATLMSAIDRASAQSPNSYPWCSRSGDRTNANVCYFRSKEECLRTTSGIGVLCFPSPYYHQPPTGRSSGRQSSERGVRAERR
jgi:Protein of unknown function (DUF3551)